MQKISLSFINKINSLQKSFISQSIGQTFKLLAKIFISIMYARYLGPAGFGELNYAIALTGIIGPLGGFGMKQNLGALLCEDYEREALISNGLVISILGRIITCLIFIPIIYLTENITIKKLLFILIIGEFFNVSEIFEVELLNIGRGSKIAKIISYQVLIELILSINAVFINANIIKLACIQSIGIFFKAVLLSLEVKRIKFFILFRSLDLNLIKKILIRSLPLFLSSLFVLLYMKSDQILLEWIKGPEQVGQYSIAVKCSECLFFLPVILCQNYLPKIGGNNLEDNQKNNFLSEMYKTSWILGLFMMFLNLFIIPKLVPIVFGNEYNPACSALIFLAPGAFGVACGCASNTWLNRKGYLKIILRRSLVGAIFNIILDLFLIPKYGFNGAAIATSISYLLSFFHVVIYNANFYKHIFEITYPFNKSIKISN